MRNTVLYLLLLGFLSSCQPSGQNSPIPQVQEVEHVKIAPGQLEVDHSVYVPVYSSIYHQDGARKFSLTVTLSIRNTTFTDSLYISSIDYYDSSGELLRQYTNETILLKPMESISFVVETREESGGPGANFVVRWGAEHEVSPPLVQAVMIGTTGQQGLSYITEGVPME